MLNYEDVMSVRRLEKSIYMLTIAANICREIGEQDLLDWVNTALVACAEALDRRTFGKEGVTNGKSN